MTGYAVVFAGQGAQKPGMGKSLYETSPAAREIFELAGEEIMYDCFQADAEHLALTEVTQPAVYTVDMAAYAALRERITEEPSGFAGFSLGEYAAFTAAGAIYSFEEGLALVKARSRVMKEAGERSGAMAAGMGERDAVLSLVDKARGEDVLEAVNYNSSLQTVVAGDSQAVERFASFAASDRGLGVKAIKLPVSGAFHSPLMKTAADAFAEELKKHSFIEPSLPVYLNITGGKYEEYSDAALGTTNAKIKAIMVCQMYNPVFWQQTIEAMKDDGIKTVIEVGPGKVLTGLVKKTAQEMAALHVEDAETLAETIKNYERG